MCFIYPTLNAYDYKYRWKIRIKKIPWIMLKLITVDALQQSHYVRKKSI